MSISLEIPYPPSTNKIYGVNKRGGRYLKKPVKVFREAVHILFIASRQKPMGSVKVELQANLIRPDYRKRDYDNTLKNLGDAIQAAGMIDDDCQIERAVIQFKDKDLNKKGGSCLIQLIPYEQRDN